MTVYGSPEALKAANMSKAEKKGTENMVGFSFTLCA